MLSLSGPPEPDELLHSLAAVLIGHVGPDLLLQLEQLVIILNADLRQLKVALEDKLMQKCRQVVERRRLLPLNEGLIASLAALHQFFDRLETRKLPVRIQNLALAAAVILRVGLAVNSPVEVDYVQRRGEIDERVPEVVLIMLGRHVDIIVAALLTVGREHHQNILLRAVYRDVAQHNRGPLLVLVEEDASHVDLLQVADLIFELDRN